MRDLSSEQWGTLLDLSPDGFALVRHRDDVVVRCNVAFAREFGLSPEEVVGRRESDLNAPVDPEARGERLRRLEQDGSYSVIERQLRRPDGSVRWVSASVALVEIDGELYRVGFGQDISERKRVEEALCASEAMYASAFAASPDGIALLGRSKPDHELRILECNENFGRITGLDPREAVGKTVHELGLAQDTEERGAITAELKATGKYTDHEIWIHAKDGTRRALNVRGRALQIDGEECFLFVARDITEHKLLLDERTRLMQELRTTLDRIETLRGIVPICAECKKIRNDDGYWEQVEVYVRDRSLAEFSHGLCPECAILAFDALDGD